jgi:hypothetical protein
MQRSSRSNSASSFQEMKRSNSVGSSDELSIAHSGEEGTTEYRLQAVESTRGQKISLWHDISLVHVDPDTRKETEYLNFVCEIPKFSRFVLGVYGRYAAGLAGVCGSTTKV